LDLLTEHRAKPAVPFAGMYRLIDFPLSNCLHSGVADVWVLQQYQPASLNDHLANGRPWDLDRTTGGLLVLPPYQGAKREGWTQGTADGLWRNAQLIRDVEPRTVVVVSADAVYRLNYSEVVRRHRASDAVLTMVTAEVAPDDAGRYGVVQVDGDRITEYEYKPDDPKSNLVSNEVFVFDPDPVLTELEKIGNEVDDDDGLGDLGDELLPRLVDSGRVRRHHHDGYWRDVGTIEAYLEANLDLCSSSPPIDLDDDDWPIRTQGGHRAAAWITETGSVQRSLVSAAATVSGDIVHSVIASGVTIAEGARVEDSVLLPGVVVGPGAVVVNSVVDDSVRIGRNATVGGPGEIALLGDFAEVPERATVKPGDRYPRSAQD
jgi:glucose-1-phosphate adenylyltransferase